MSDRTSLDDARLIKIIHRCALDLLTSRHEENKANRDNLAILSGLLNMRSHRGCSYRNNCIKNLQAEHAGNTAYED